MNDDVRSESPVLLQNARLGLGDVTTAVLVSGGEIVAMGKDLSVPAGAQAVDVSGRPVLPGLWDHHVHFDQWTLVQHWLDVSGAHGPHEVARRVADRLRTDPPDPGLPLVGYGFRDALWSEPAHRRHLDAIPTDQQVIVVSGDLHQAWLNAPALLAVGLPADHDGLLREDEWFPHVDRIRQMPLPVLDRWAAETAVQAAARGVVGVVDYESTDNLAAWTRRHRRSRLTLRVRAAVWPEHLERAIAAGLRTGAAVPGADGLVTMGHLKVITDGSLNTRTAYCYDPYPGHPNQYGWLTVPPDQLMPLMRRASQHGIGCSIHAIGDHANTLVLDAFEATGASGSVEHAQLLSTEDVARFAALGVAASVQPEHAHDDRDVADHLWAGRTGRAYPYGELHRSGCTLLLGSDAPVAPLDPLLTIGAAISRSRDGRQPWHPEHELPLDVAIAASTTVGRTTPRVGDPADLTVPDLDLRNASAEDLRQATVAGTMMAGHWTHRNGL